MDGWTVSLRWLAYSGSANHQGVFRVRIDTWESTWNGRYGGPKAKRDIVAILKHFSASVRVHQAGLDSSFFPSTDADVAVFQYPTRGMTPPERHSQLNLFVEAWRLNWRRRIVFMHDIKSVQQTLFCSQTDEASPQDWRLCEQRIFQSATHVIVHSEAMATEARRLFVLDSQQLVTLGLFDYLCAPSREVHVPVHERHISVAFCGNLHASRLADELSMSLPKAPRLRYLFYGSRVASALWLRADVQWMGDFNPDVLPHQLRKSGAAFGLCWWGSDVMCSTYLAFTSPHKASCYIAAGIPILVPSGSYLAELATAYGVGLHLGELRELAFVVGEASGAQRKTLTTNAIRLGQQVRGGYFTRSAFAAALNTPPPNPGATFA